jgi:helicase-like protein
MDHDRPDTAAILGQLKDFQRDTVEYVFRRMYLDADFSPRFLVADEVGLGKTLVARGLIAKTIDDLWDRSRRIDIVYVCSNTDIARQNITKLNVTGHKDFTLSSRITLLPITVSEMQHRRVNFVSFTPGTSFELSENAGQSIERQLLYWMLSEPWAMSFNKATRVFQGRVVDTDRFREQIKHFNSDRVDRGIHQGIARQFVEAAARDPELRLRFDNLCDELPRAGVKIPDRLIKQRNTFLGDLRRLLAQCCLRWLEPDLIILDEFQRFKHLLGGDDDTDGASPAAQLAHHLFNYQESQGDPATAARVLLLSATPYKMYTLSHEEERDDHYQDFRGTLRFLSPAKKSQQQFDECLEAYRQQLFRLANGGLDGLLRIKSELEHCLRQVMVRTERLALRSDRNGMLREVSPEFVSLSAPDVEQYLQLQRIARALDHDDVLEYWKSAPYLLNFMDDYDLKRKLRDAIKSPQQDTRLIRAIRRAQSGWLNRDEIERYSRLDPANSRLRALHRDTIERGTWRLLWIPPSLPYYVGRGPFADPDLSRFTKRLVFSCWRVVPKAIASVLSYEAERCMIQTFRKKAQNTAEARKKRRPLLRFRFREGRPTGMTVLGLIYPCRAFAEWFDPLKARLTTGQLPTLDEATQQATAVIRDRLNTLISGMTLSSGPADESWYWAAPLLLDLQHDNSGVREWFAQPKLSEIWAGDQSPADAENDTHRGWAKHARLAKDVIEGRTKLGPPPDDLAETLALLAIAGPGVVAYRTLNRIAISESQEGRLRLRSTTAALAHSFLHLFNLPEVTTLLRDRHRQTPYWRSVLDYCAAGNLQAVLDEYAHLLAEAPGMSLKDVDVVQEVAGAIQHCLTLRTATARAELISATQRSVRPPEPIRLRTRFAMRFGDQEEEVEGGAPTRADHVRQAFNSPFWPFVLATTSVGQEGLDFHPYCHAVVHWNLPSNPVDLEQREGRVHRYKGHALRKNIAARFAAAANNGDPDPWKSIFRAAQESRAGEECDLFPFWISPNGDSKIERHMLVLPESREKSRYASLRRSLVLYRMVFGQNRQEDLVAYLQTRLPESEVQRIADLCHINLSPPPVSEASLSVTKDSFGHHP